jgi:type I restriction enzyme M protein
LTNPQIGEKIYDPFCGTGGFLIESFRHIWNTMARTEVNEKILREQTIYGNEITNTARITKMNMILAGDGHSNIHMQDSLANPVDGTEEYDEVQSDGKTVRKHRGHDIVITNMPYSQKTRYGSLYDLPSNNGDSICVQHCMKAVNSIAENGRMALVVPEGFLFRKDLSKTRELLLKNCELQSVISLPQGVFLPYTGVKTNIIYAIKVNQKLSSSQKRKNFWYFDVKSDGYSLDNHRRKLDSGSDLDKYQEYRKLDDDQRKEMLNVGFEIVPINKVKENSYILVGSRYKEQKINSRFKVKAFEQIATLTRGVTYSKTVQATKETETIVLPADNIDLSGNLILNKLIYLYNNINFPEEKKLKCGDIFICMSSGSKEHIGKVAYVSEDTNYFAGGFMGIIRVNPTLCISKWLYYYLRFSAEYRNEIKVLTQGANINNISSLINKLMIPVPPLKMQQQMVDEFDRYQQAIDEAKVTINNYTKITQDKINKIWDV